MCVSLSIDNQLKSGTTSFLAYYLSVFIMDQIESKGT